MNIINADDKILVTGAGGFIGTNMVLFLIDRGYRVLGVDKKYSKNQKVNEFLEILDVCEEEKFLNLCFSFSPDYIIHLAAETGMESDSCEDFSSNYESVSVLAKVVNSVRSIKKIIMTSSLLVCKNGYIPQNDFDFCPPNGYGHSKVRAEAACRQLIDESKWDIVRPTSVWGEYFDGGYLLFFKLIKRKLFFLPTGASIIKPTCYVGNAVFMIEKIMRDSGFGRVFYLSDYPSSSVQEWASAISHGFYGKSKVFVVPLFFLKAVSFVGDFLKLFKISFPLTSSRLANMLTSQRYPSRNLKEVVGGLPFDIKSSVNRTIEWVDDQG